MENCVFCKLAQGNHEKFIYENDSFFSVPDIKPAMEGHSLVISKNHFKTLLDTPDSIGSELLDCVKNTTLNVIKNTKSEGFNIISNNFPSAGQVVHHVHFHIIPRKKDDGFKFER